MKLSTIFANFMAFFFFAWIACQQEPKSEYQLALEQSRREKDEGFKHNANSPLPESIRSDFHGLPYFAIHERFRFEGPIARYDHPDTFQLATSDGRTKKALRYGYFEFQLEDQAHRLQVYRLLTLPAQYAHYLFIPFSDETSGEESYGGGRYLDLEENAENRYVVDFNTAYNPSCAYGRKDFSCPIPPAENHLTARIAAGEKKWKNSH